MQQQLRRIKSKDLSSLDQRLFGNLDKVQTINSTIENLGQFQQFLLKQISQYEEKAKTSNNNNKEVAEVIEQNCMTLRESIMMVVPDDLEQSRSRMIEARTSPINGFRATKTNGFGKFIGQNQEVSTSVTKSNNDPIQNHQCKEKQLMEIIANMQSESKLTIKRFNDLKTQISSVKAQFSQLRRKSKEIDTEFRKEFEKTLKKQVQSFIQQNTKQKQECEKLSKENFKLMEEITCLKKKQAERQTQKKLQKLFQNPLPLSNLTLPHKQSEEAIFQSKLSMRKSLLASNKQIKQPPTPAQKPRSRIQHHLQLHTNEPQYKSFKDRMMFDFTTKLNRFGEESDVKATKVEELFGEGEDGGQDTFREGKQSRRTEVIGGAERGLEVEDRTRTVFRSVEISRNHEVELLDPNVPKLLKRNNPTSQYHSSSVSQSPITNHRLPFQPVNPNLHHTQSTYQSLEKLSLTKNLPSSGTKRPNHDLMRKTKSNFFKQPVQNKENFNQKIVEQVYNTDIARMKGLVRQVGVNGRKRNSQSKQKLKIFSMF